MSRFSAMYSKGWSGNREFSRTIVKDGIVTLTGGVKGVSNLIVVKPGVSPSDIKGKIEEALKRTAERDAA
jgi:hypothetical protein